MQQLATTSVFSPSQYSAYLFVERLAMTITKSTLADRRPHSLFGQPQREWDHIAVEELENDAACDAAPRLEQTAGTR